MTETELLLEMMRVLEVTVCSLIVYLIPGGLVLNIESCHHCALCSVRKRPAYLDH